MSFRLTRWSLLGCALAACLPATTQVPAPAPPAPVTAARPEQGPPPEAGDPKSCPALPADLHGGAVVERPTETVVPGDRIVTTLITAADVNTPRLTCGIEVRLFLPGDVRRPRGAFVDPWTSKTAPGRYLEESFRAIGFASIGLKLRHEPAEWHISKGPTLGRALVVGLRRIAEQLKRPELAELPLVLAGHSRAGVWARDIAFVVPERTIAYANVSGWIAKPKTDQQRAIPALFVLGSETTPKEPWRMLTAVAREYLPGRAAGAPWAVAYQWGLNEHGSRDEAPLVFAYLKGAIDARLRAGGARRPLRPVAPDAGWVGDTTAWTLLEGPPRQQGAAPEIVGVKPSTTRPIVVRNAQATAGAWLPDRTTAEIWRAFHAAEPQVSLRVLDAANGRDLLKGKPVRALVPAGQTLHVQLAGDDLPARVQLFDGARRLGTLLPGRSFRYQATTAGAHLLMARWRTGEGDQVTRPVLVVVSGARVVVRARPSAGAGTGAGA